MNTQNRGSSGFAGVFAVVAVLAYLGLEVHGLRRAQESMQPASIYREYVGARRAVDACGADDEERMAFDKNFAVVTAQAAAALAAGDAQSDAAEQGTALAQARQVREGEVDALLAKEGCGGKTVWRLLKLHEVRSRLSLGDD